MHEKKSGKRCTRVVKNDLEVTEMWRWGLLVWVFCIFAICVFLIFAYYFWNNKRLVLSTWNKTKINKWHIIKSVIVSSWLFICLKWNTIYAVVCLAGATMSALTLTACIIWCICSIKSNRHKDGFHRLRQHHDEYEDEIRLMSTSSKKSLLSHEFQDETDTEEETLYSSKHWNTYLAYLPT